LDLLKSLAAAREFAHNGFDGGRPDKRSSRLLKKGFSEGRAFSPVSF